MDIPSPYVQSWITSDGVPVVIRPIRPEDEPLLIAFHQTLGSETVRQRYFGSIALETRTAHDRLARVCFNDNTRELALVVEHDDKAAGRREILAVGRLSRIPNTHDAELALLVSDTAQHRGIGAQLAACLVAAARSEGLGQLRAWTMRDNLAMRRILQKSGFTVDDGPDSSTISAHLTLAP